MEKKRMILDIPCELNEKVERISSKLNLTKTSVIKLVLNEYYENNKVRYDD